MTPENLRTLAASVAWQDRSDVRDAMLAAADRLALLAPMEAAIRAFIRSHATSVDGGGFTPEDDPFIVGSCGCDECREAWAILRRLDKERGHL